MQVSFPSNDSGARHRCEARRFKNWVVFTCPQCPGFERRIDLETGAMHTRPGADPYVLHEGFYVPVGLEHTGSLHN